MSADNWEVCPRCEATRQQELAAMERAITESYGKVPVEEFDAARAHFEEKRAELPAPTFREDYEIGLSEGVFFVNYGGGCRECGLEHKFSHEEPLR